MQVSVKIDSLDALKSLGAAAKQVAYATAVALTKTAKDVQIAERNEMRAVFKNPVAFTLNSLYLKRADRSSLVAKVGVKDQGRSAINWLLPEIEGGPRPGGIEVFLRPVNLPPTGLYAVPGSEAPMNRAGHLNVAALRRIVSELKSQPGGVSGGVAGLKRRSGSKAQYFALEKPYSGLPAGIFAVKGRKVLPIILFVRKPAYRKRLNFYTVATHTAQKVFAQRFKVSLAEALAGAR